jgi:hypothetical protein
MTKCKTYQRAFVVDVDVLEDFRDHLAAGELHKRPDPLV